MSSYASVGVIAIAGCNYCRIRCRQTACDSEQGRQNKRLRYLGCRPSWRRLPFTWKLCFLCPQRRRAPHAAATRCPRLLLTYTQPQTPTIVYGQFYQDPNP